jgi:hypothetical protein
MTYSEKQMVLMEELRHNTLKGLTIECLTYFEKSITLILSNIDDLIIHYRKGN